MTVPSLATPSGMLQWHTTCCPQDLAPMGHVVACRLYLVRIFLMKQTLEWVGIDACPGFAKILVPRAGTLQFPRLLPFITYLPPKNATYYACQPPPPPAQDLPCLLARGSSDRCFSGRSFTFSLLGTAFSKHKYPSDCFFLDFQRTCARGRSGGGAGGAQAADNSVQCG